MDRRTNHDDTVTIWILNREQGLLGLTTIYAADLPKFRRVRALSEGQWLDAYEFRCD